MNFSKKELLLLRYCVETTAARCELQAAQEIKNRDKKPPSLLAEELRKIANNLQREM